MRKHWHLQMNQPEGRDGYTIETKDMLRENPPVIGIGEWDDSQCVNFKQNIHKGDIVFVREGNRAIALCKIKTDSYNDDNLEKKYRFINYRQVEVLDWAENYKQPGEKIFSQGTFMSCRETTEQYKYIDGWIEKINEDKKKDDGILKKLIKRLFYFKRGRRER